jgi:hypothetical protein
VCAGVVLASSDASFLCPRCARARRDAHTPCASQNSRPHTLARPLSPYFRHARVLFSAPHSLSPPPFAFFSILGGGGTLALMRAARQIQRGVVGVLELFRRVYRGSQMGKERAGDALFVIVAVVAHAGLVAYRALALCLSVSCELKTSVRVCVKKRRARRA